MPKRHRPDCVCAGWGGGQPGRSVSWGPEPAMDRSRGCGAAYRTDSPVRARRDPAFGDNARRITRISYRPDMAVAMRAAQFRWNSPWKMGCSAVHAFPPSWCVKLDCGRFSPELPFRAVASLMVARCHGPRNRLTISAAAATTAQTAEAGGGLARSTPKVRHVSLHLRQDWYASNPCPHCRHTGSLWGRARLGHDISPASLRRG